MFTAQNVRNLDENIHGSFYSLATTQTINASTTATVTNGIGKLVLAVINGIDVNGTVSAQGTRVDRNTGVETANFIEAIAITGVTIDGSDVDAEGNVRHSLTGAYITAN